VKGTPASKSPALGFASLPGRIVDTCSSYFGFLGAILLFLSSLAISYEIIARYIFKAPTIWSYEISIILISTAVFMTVAYGLRIGGHVNVSILSKYLPQATNDLLDIIAVWIICAFSVFYVVMQKDMLLHSIKVTERTSMLFLPAWPIKAMVLLSFVILAIQAAREGIKKIRIFLASEMPSQVKKTTAMTILVYIIAVIATLFIWKYINSTAGVFLLMIVLLINRLPIGFSMAFASAIGFIGILGFNGGVSEVVNLYSLVWNEFSIISLPLYVFLGYIMHKSGMASELFAFARALIGHVTGGLAVASLMVCAFFASISGSSTANALTVGLIAIPEMERYKYDKKLAAGVVAVGGTLGILIPPSACLIMIGILSQESIGKLFMAGIIPGVIAFLFLSVMAIFRSKKSGMGEAMPKASSKDRVISFRKTIGSLILPLVLLSGIYSGIFTATEGAAVAVVYALLYALLTRRIKVSDLGAVITESTKTVAMLAILIAGGMALANTTAMLRLPQMAARYVVTSGWPIWSIILAFLVLVIILGMFLDGNSVTILTIPIAAPVMHALGVNMIWFAVLFVMCSEIGLISPPVGMNTFVVQQVSGVDFIDVIKGALPFLLMMFVVLALVAFFPQLALWLPGTMR
jgi:C4-dicarboxylate transporter DctM subunit